MKQRLAALGLLALGACGFDDATPPGGVILCAQDADCPSGQTCDVAAHQCVAPGDTVDVLAPALLDAALSPPVASSGTVELTFTADEELGAAPVLYFEGVIDPGFRLVDSSGATARLAVDVDEVAEGAYPLGAVELVDVRGNRAARLTPGLTLVVDRRAPVVHSLLVQQADAAAATLPFSANPGTNQLDIRFFLDEPVALEDVGVTAGPVAATCALGEANTVACSATVTPAFTDGRDRVTVEVRDGAGNVGTAARDIPTDLRAPVLVDDVLVLRSPGRAAPVGAAVAGGTLELELIFDEPLRAPPGFVLQGDVDWGALLVEPLTPVRWRLVATVTTVGAAGTATVHAQVEDQVGNGVMLPVANVPLALAVLSSCAPLDPTAACADFDGDGDYAITPQCGARGGDCDDTDPLTRSDGVEIPGDGADNDCANDGDAPIDETQGVFVDALAPAGGDGTRANPVRTLEEGTALLAGRSWLFLAEAPGSTYSRNSPLASSLLGGLDGNWLRQPGHRSRVLAAGFWAAPGENNVAIMDSVDLDNSNQPAVLIYSYARLTAVRSDLPAKLVVTDRLLAFESELHPLTIDDGVTGSLVSHSMLHESLTLGSGAQLLMLAVDAEDVTDAVVGPDVMAAAASSLEVINSWMPPILCDGCTLRVSHSAISTVEPGITALIDVRGSPAIVDLRNNIFYWPDGDPGGACVRNDNGQARVLANLFYAPFAGALLFADSTFTTANVDVLNACGPPDCVDGDRNLLANPMLAAERGHIELSSPAVGMAAPAWEGLPAAVASDLDGDCRTPLSPEIGPDEK